MRRDDDHVVSLRHEVEREDPVDGRPMELGWPRPFKIGEELEAAEPRIQQSPLGPLVEAGREFRLRELFEQDDGTPALLARGCAFYGCPSCEATARARVRGIFKDRFASPAVAWALVAVFGRGKGPSTYQIQVTLDDHTVHRG